MTAKPASKAWVAFSSVTGTLLVGLALACNELTLARISSDGVLRGDTKVLIRAFELAALVAGVALLASRRSALLRKTFVGAMAGLALLIAADVLVGVVGSPRRDELQVEHSHDPYLTDELLGKKPRPDSSIQARLRVDGGVAYDVTYRFDELSRRRTPADPSNGRDTFALFFGGSFTLGEGVEEDQALPARVARLSPNRMPYNYGFSGYGTQQMLATLEGRDLRSEVSETTGLLVYTFLDDHVDRTVGTFRVCTSYAFGLAYPYYVRRGEGVIRRQSFAAGRPLLSAVYRALSRSRIIEHLAVDFPRIGAEDLRTTAAVIAAARDRFRRTFASEDFYVLFFPAYSERYVDQMVPLLQRAGIACLDYSDLFGEEQEEYWIPNAWHPSALGYHTVAERLVADLDAE